MLKLILDKGVYIKAHIPGSRRGSVMGVIEGTLIERKGSTLVLDNIILGPIRVTLDQVYQVNGSFIKK